MFKTHATYATYNYLNFYNLAYLKVFSDVEVERAPHTRTRYLQTELALGREKLVKLLLKFQKR